MPPIEWLKAFTVILIFGCNFVAGKLGVSAFPALFLMVLRFTVVLAASAPWARIPARQDARRLAAAGLLLGCGHFGCLFVGLQGLNASVAALLIQLQVPMAALWARRIDGEKLPPLGWAAMGMALLGVTFLGGDPELRGSPGHFMLVLLGAFFWAAVQPVLRGLSDLSAPSKNAAVAACAIPVLALTSWATEGGQWQAVQTAPPTGWGAVLYMSLGSSVVGYGLWYGLIARHPMNRIVPLTLLVPLVAVAASVVFLNEPVTWELVVGGVFIVGGVAAVIFSQM